MTLAITYVLTVHALAQVLGHARLWDPPARSTMWRMGFNTPVNTNDNELNCGGYEVGIHVPRDLTENISL